MSAAKPPSFPDRTGSLNGYSRRVLVVAPQPFYEHRGTPIALKNVLQAASQRGYEVDLLTFPIGEPVQVPGLRIFRTGTWLPIRHIPIGFSVQKAILDLFLLPAILKRCRQEMYRCVYALEEAAFLALLLRRWHSLPVVYDMQSSLPEQLKNHPLFGRAVPQRLLRHLEWWMIRNATRVVCSAGLMAHVRSVVPDRSVEEWFFPAIPEESPPVEPDCLRRELRLDPKSRIVLYTGNFEPYQGLKLLLDAAPKVVAEIPDTVFLLVGNNAGSGLALSKQAEKLRRRGALVMIPQRPKAEVHRFLALADVVVSPRENTGNVGLKVFEYLAAGKPIVATDTAAHRAVLDEGRAVFADPSPDGLAKAILFVLRDRTAAIRLGESARAYAEQYLTWDVFADRVADLCSANRR